MRRFTLYLFLLFSICCNHTQAQSSLGFGATTFSKDTLFLGDTLFIHTYLKNNDTNAYTDTVAFKLKINGILNINQNIFPNPLNNQGINLPAGDSLSITLIAVITPAYYLIGPDILVVWPVANTGGLAHDSIIKQIIVVENTGLNDGPDARLRIFCTQNQLNIESTDDNLGLNHVRIFDVQGRELVNREIAGSTSIPFRDYPTGLYLIEVTGPNNQRQVYRIYKP